MLSLLPASNCAPRWPIISRVATFGEALKSIRGARKPRAIARAALGSDADAKALKGFVNYLLRIERDDAGDNLGMDVIRSLMKGLGYPTVSSFFLQIEALQSKAKEPTVTGPLAGQDGYAPDLAASIDPTTIAQLLQRIEVLERSALHDIKNTDRKRKDSARTRTKPASRAKDRTHARRRA